MGQLLYKLSFNFSISVDLFLPNFFKVAFHFALSFLLDHVILHHVGHNQQIICMLKLRSLGLHQDPQNLTENIGKPESIGYQCDGNIQGL